jgi:predicted short-subunit dehydrogenase-like oxidoreductase (DUF2520 family)
MRELERDPFPDARVRGPLAVVGAGRLGTALAAVLSQAGHEVMGPLGRGAAADGAFAVLLCVPDAEIAAAAAAVKAGPLVGHCSGVTGLDPLLPHEAFSLHPLMSVTDRRASFRGAGAAVAGSTPRALSVARELALGLGMEPVEVAERDRPAYHAAASIASNFLITLEAAAEQLAATVGVERRMLVPLVRATVENWANLGPERALTGPLARGDEATVALQRAAVEEHAPELTALFDALTEATRRVAAAGQVLL